MTEKSNDEALKKEVLDEKAVSPLKIDETMYQIILENILDTIIVTDEQGKMIYVCPNSVVIFGRGPDEILGFKTIENLMKGRVCDLSKLKARQALLNIEWAIENARGETRFLLINVKSISNNQGAVLYMMRDITERKQQNLNLKKYRAVISSTTDGIALLDESYRYILVNDAYEKISGGDQSKFIGLTVAEYLGEDVFTRLIKPHFDKCLQGETINYQEWFDDPALGRRYVDITYSPYRNDDNQIAGIIATTRDITDRKETELALRDSEEQFKYVFDNSLIGMSLTMLSGKMHTNKALQKMLGYSKDELHDLKWQDITHPDDIELSQQAIDSMLTGEIDSGQLIKRYLHKDGSIVWTEVRSALRRDQDNTPLYLMTSINDITDRKRAEAHSKKLQAQLLQAQKMESIGTLAGGIAHDFNNVLSPIIGFTELAMNDLPKSHPVQENLEYVLDGAKRAQDLVKQILLFSRQKKPLLKPIRLKPVIEEALRLVRSSIPKNIDIQQDLYEGEDLVLCDATQVHEIVLNLCTNAHHAVEDGGGLIRVGLKKVKPDPKLNLVDENYICLSVRDDGIGIPSKDINKIFEPYYTSKKVGKGSGLGLSVVHGIVKSYRGEMLVKSAPGKGSVFKAFLPITENIAPVESETQIRKISGGTEKILFVDDEKVIVKLGVKALMNAGYEVIGVYDGLDALAMIQSDPDEFDLVITDMAMPGMVGSQLAKKILEIRPGMPIIVCSGYSEKLETEKSRLTNVRAFIDKPIRVTELREKVREVLNQG